MEKPKQTVLVTGGAGYIGSVLVRLLLSSGYVVRVIDNLRFGGEALLELVANPDFKFVKGDFRDKGTLESVVPGCFAVVHLGAIVGDPACRKEPDLARSTNLDGSYRLWEAANLLGCQRFVFASTCSNYGKMPDPNVFMTEDSVLQPLSIYSECKVEIENFLLNQPRSSYCKPTCLRFSTVYGLSPRIRFDLTVNEFTRELVLGKELVIFGEQFWRPYCHVVDLARSVLITLQADLSSVAFEVFNVGDTSENYTKQMIVTEILKQVPQAKVRYVPQGQDQRDYRVNFDKIKKRIGFSITKQVAAGIREIREILDLGLLHDAYDPRYSNI